MEINVKGKETMLIKYLVAKTKKFKCVTIVINFSPFNISTVKIEDLLILTEQQFIVVKYILYIYIYTLEFIVVAVVILSLSHLRFIK